jgi:hypothetical protein
MRIIVMCVCAMLAACDGGDTIEEPDAQVIDAGAPDACNPFHAGCAGCGEAGRGCCLRAEAPTMYCLADDLVCDPVAVNCVELDAP